MPLLSTVITTFNEEQNIDAVISAWTAQFKTLQIAAQILVIDDGSRDRTHEILLQAEERDPGSGSGHEVAVLAGEAAGLGVVLRARVDANREPRQQRVGASRFAVGSRDHSPGRRGHTPLQ